jgi:adenylosuccinate lyase
MEAVRRGGDRQELHERLRVHARAAADRRSSDGEPADLFERIATDPVFRLTREDLIDASRPERLVGRAAEQVEAFVREELDPALENVEAAQAVPLKV